MRSDYIIASQFEHILAALTNENRLAIEVSLTTGLRIGDVLNLRTKDLKERMTVREEKTNKNRTIRLQKELFEALLSNSGKIFVFEHRLDYTKHRTRQAVYKDIKRACKAFRITKGLQISPHSARKIYAVGQFKRTCNLSKVKALLNHNDEAVTMLYAMADELSNRKLKRRAA